jgi:hypothetical protein
MGFIKVRQNSLVKTINNERTTNYADSTSEWAKADVR